MTDMSAGETPIEPLPSIAPATESDPPVEAATSELDAATVSELGQERSLPFAGDLEHLGVLRQA